MNHLSVRIKILLLAAIMLFITCIVAAVGIFATSQAKQSIDDMYNYNLMTTQYLNDANTQLQTIISHVSYVQQQNFTVENRKIILKDISDKLKIIEDDVHKVKEIDRSQRAQETIAALEGNLSDFQSKVKAAEALGMSQEDRGKLLDELSGVSAISSNLAVLTPDNVLQGKLLFEDNTATYDRTIKIFAGIILLGLIVGIAAATYIAQNIAGPLGTSVQQLNAVADGDLTQEIPPELSQRQDEVGSMVQALEKMQASLRNVLREVRGEADKSADMVQEVQHLVGDLNESTQDMSAVTEEMSAGMEETAASTMNLQTLSDRVVKKIHENAKGAEESESYTGQVAERAGRLQSTMAQSYKEAEGVYNTTKTAVEEAIESAKVVEQINSLTGEITQIAEQTNLLALNAAIEAARAGEHGRGFAVVADEVRKLAEQSSSSAGEIASLITSIQAKARNAVSVMEDGVTQVQNGVGAVNGAGNSFKDIAEMVQQVAEETDEMERTVTGLASSAMTISEAVTKISEMSRNVASEAETVSAATEEQTATMNEIAGASRRLTEMAKGMEASVEKFKI